MLNTSKPLNKMSTFTLTDYTVLGVDPLTSLGCRPVTQPWWGPVTQCWVLTLYAALGVDPLCYSAMGVDLLDSLGCGPVRQPWVWTRYTALDMDTLRSLGCGPVTQPWVWTLYYEVNYRVMVHILNQFKTYFLLVLHGYSLNIWRWPQVQIQW